MYHLRPEEALALRAVEHQTGVRALLLEGPPGCGKTSFGDVIAEQLRATLVYCLCHSWTDDAELFVGVDVAAAVAGEADHVRQPGVLARAAELSHSGPVVVVIDELDKAPERVDALLLDVLQTGRVPVRPGVHEQIDLTRTVFVLTSNGARPHIDALMRRVRRVRMRPIPVEVLDGLAADASGAPKGVVTIASKLARAIAEGEGTILSVQELSHLCRDLWRVAMGARECQLLLAQWAARTERGASAAATAPVASLWGEVLTQRRHSA